MQSYLPSVGNHVVAGCFNPVYDPQAPNVVLPGRGPVIQGSAEKFAIQGHAVPVFLKRRVNFWEYVGQYRVVRQSHDLDEIEVYAQRARRIGDVTSVLFLDAV